MPHGKVILINTSINTAFLHRRNDNLKNCDRKKQLKNETNYFQINDNFDKASCPKKKKKTR